MDPHPPTSADFPSDSGWGEVNPHQGNLLSLSKGGEVLETAVGAVFALAKLSLERSSIRGPSCRQNSLQRNSGVGGGGQNWVLNCEGRGQASNTSS